MLLVKLHCSLIGTCRARNTFESHSITGLRLPHPTSDQLGGYQAVAMTCQSASLMHGVLGTLGAPSQARGHCPTGALHTPYMRSASNANLTPRIWGILQGRKYLIVSCLTRGQPKKKIHWWRPNWAALLVNHVYRALPHLQLTADATAGADVYCRPWSRPRQIPQRRATRPLVTEAYLIWYALAARRELGAESNLIDPSQKTGSSQTTGTHRCQCPRVPGDTRRPRRI